MLTLAEARAVLEPEFAKAREIGRAEARETMQAELTKAHTALRNANSEAFKQGFKQGVKDGVKDGYQKGTEDAKETAEAKLAEMPAEMVGQAKYLTEGFTFALNEFHKAMAEVHADRESVSHAQTRANKKFGKAFQKLLRLLMQLGVDVGEHGYADSPLNQAIIDFWTAAETELLDLVTKKLKANARKAAKDGLLSQQQPVGSSLGGLAKARATLSRRWPKATAG